MNPTAKEQVNMIKEQLPQLLLQKDELETRLKSINDALVNLKSLLTGIQLAEQAEKEQQQ